MGYAVLGRGGRQDTWRGSSAGAYLDVPTTTANVKGAWFELCAALPVASDLLSVYIGGGSVPAYYQIDIGIGAAGAEVPIIQNLLHRSDSDYAVHGHVYDIRIPLAAGTRIVVRQCNNVGSARQPRVAVVSRCSRGAGRPAPVARFTSYGASAFSAGTDVDPGGTIQTKGAWVQFTAACTYPVRLASFSVVQQSGFVFQSFRFDIGVGAAGAEVAVGKDLPLHVADLGRGIPPGTGWVDVNIPAGTRLSMRCAGDSNAANRIPNLVLHCQG